MGGGAKGRTHRPTHQQPPHPAPLQGVPRSCPDTTGSLTGDLRQSPHLVSEVCPYPIYPFTPFALQSEHLFLVLLVRAGVGTLRLQTLGLGDLRVEKPGREAGGSYRQGYGRPENHNQHPARSGFFVISSQWPGSSLL